MGFGIADPHRHWQEVSIAAFHKISFQVMDFWADPSPDGVHCNAGRPHKAQRVCKNRSVTAPCDSDLIHSADAMSCFGGLQSFQALSRE